MTIESVCEEIKELCKIGSNDAGDLRFFHGTTSSKQNIEDFENKYKFKLPIEYCYFLENVGSVSLYIDEYELGFEFLELDNIVSFSKEIFVDIKNPFPNLILIASNTGRGDFIGFYKDKFSNEYSLSIFSSEEDPELWCDEVETSTTLGDWLRQLVESDGENDLI